MAGVVSVLILLRAAASGTDYFEGISSWLAKAVAARFDAQKALLDSKMVWSDVRERVVRLQRSCASACEQARCHA